MVANQTGLQPLQFPARGRNPLFASLHDISGMPSVPTLVNILARVTKAVALLNGDLDSQAAALLHLEKRQVSLFDPRLLVDLHGVWVDHSFWDQFWHSSISKFWGRERDLVVAVAEQALHRLYYILGSLEVQGTLLDCFSLTVDVLLSLSAGSLVSHCVAGSRFRLAQ